MDLDRAERIGTCWGHPETRTFGELLIDLEEDRTLSARRDACGLSALHELLQVPEQNHSVRH
jgi:hypothetical protein